MALIYLGYRALKKKMGDGNQEEELTEEEKNAKLAEPVKTSKAKCKYFLNLLIANPHLTAVGGAAGGAAIGSMIFPGVGTVIGAGVGAVMGTKAAEKDKVKKEHGNKQELDRINTVKRLEAQSEALYDTINVIVIRYEAVKLGLHLKQNDHGVFISQVEEKSPAAEAELTSGDLIAWYARLFLINLRIT